MCSLDRAFSRHKNGAFSQNIVYISHFLLPTWKACKFRLALRYIRLLVVIPNKTSQLKWIINWKCIEITGFVICCRSACFGVACCSSSFTFTLRCSSVFYFLDASSSYDFALPFVDNSFIFVLKFKTRRNRQLLPAERLDLASCWPCRSRKKLSPS